MTCKCGHRITFGAIPCSDQWLLISDEDYDQFSGDVDTEDIYRAMQPMLKCSNCGRLWIFWDGFGNPAVAYKLD